LPVSLSNYVAISKLTYGFTLKSFVVAVEHVAEPSTKDLVLGIYYFLCQRVYMFTSK